MPNLTGYLLPFHERNEPKISWYYKYNFISPEFIYSKIKEELKSYFITGVIDDTLFPRYTEEVLRALGKGSLKIEENVFQLEDYQCPLPKDFESVRELWLVTPHELNYRIPTSCYEQALVRLDAERADRCDPKSYCAPQEIKVTYKSTGRVIHKFKCHHLLRPGNVHAQDACTLFSENRFSGSYDTFDIRAGKIATNFPEGHIFMTYYVKEYDENDYQLIPENIWIEKYIEAYIKFKCFENLYNTITDETLNQVQAKMQYYEARYLEAKVNAEVETKKQTIDQQIRSTKAARRRFNKFIIR